MENLVDISGRIARRDAARAESTLQADVRSFILHASFNHYAEQIAGNPDSVSLESHLSDGTGGRFDIEARTLVVEVKRRKHTDSRDENGHKKQFLENATVVSSALALPLIFLVTLCLSWATLLTAPPANASDHLISTYPNAGQVIDGKLDKVTVTLSEAPLVQETLDTGLISVRGPAGESVSSGSLEVVGDTAISIAAKVEKPGEHNVDWRVVSSDGQPLEGSFTFTYAPPEEDSIPTTAPQPSQEDTHTAASGQDTSDPKDAWALGISILALLVAVAAAGYTRSQAVAAKRTLALDQEPQLVLTVGTAATISSPGRKPVGGGPQLRLTNRGKGTAYEIEVQPTAWAGHTKSVTIKQLDGGREHPLGTLAQDKKASVFVTWKASDGKEYKGKLHTRQ